MSVSWRGTLAQYVGRLHRLHPEKRVVLVYDYIDDAVPSLRRMGGRRVKGYENLGYTVERPGVPPPREFESPYGDCHADRVVIRKPTPQLQSSL